MRLKPSHVITSEARDLLLRPAQRNLAGDISIEASFGGGAVPYARGTTRVQQFTTPVDYTESSRATGWYVSPGLAVRWWHFVVQQHAVQLFNVYGAVFNDENAPLTFGFRW